VDVLHLCNVFTACVQCIRVRMQFRHVCVDVLHLCDMSSTRPTCNVFKACAMYFRCVRTLPLYWEGAGCRHVCKMN